MNAYQKYPLEAPLEERAGGNTYPGKKRRSLRVPRVYMQWKVVPYVAVELFFCNSKDFVGTNYTEDGNTWN